MNRKENLDPAEKIIFVVDDEKDLAEMMARQINRITGIPQESIFVFESADGARAKIESLWNNGEKEMVDIYAFSDNNLGNGCTGVQFASGFKEDAEAGKIKFVIMSGLIDAARNEIKAAGMEEFIPSLPKPVIKQDLALFIGSRYPELMSRGG